ncbi:MAG: hypothetical protein AAF409_02275 [Pseudomonadota bacterium]
MADDLIQPRPASERPALGFGTVMNAAFALPFRHLGAMSSVIIVYALLNAAAVWLLLDRFGDTSSDMSLPGGLDSLEPFGVFGEAAGYFVAVFIVDSLINAFALAALTTHYVSAAHSRSPAIATTLQMGVRRLPQVFLVVLICSTLFVFAVASIPLILWSTLPSALILLSLVVIAQIVVFFAVSVPVAAVEGRLLGAFTRSVYLTRGYRFSLLWFHIVFFLLFMVITAVISLVALAPLALVGGDGISSFTTIAFASNLLEGVVTGVTYAIVAGFSSALYLRLREIKEGGTGGLETVFE